MKTKQKLRELIAQNQIEKVIEQLTNLEGNDTQIRNDLIFQNARFKEYKNSFFNSLDSSENLEIKIGKIRRALLDIIDGLKEEDLSELNQIKTPTKNQNTNSNSKILLVSVFLSILLFLGIIIFMPCPTASQYNFLRIILALLLSVSGGLISFFNLKHNDLFTLGTCGVIFLITYFFNPAQQIVSRKCSNEPFEYTIHLSYTKPNKSYPTLENATLKLRLENKYEDALIDKNGDADFKSIPFKFKNEKLPIKLISNYWKLQQDSIVLTNKSNNIKLEPDGTLSIIHGKVTNMETGDPLENVKIETSGIILKTSENGLFSLSIPYEKQRIEYNINASKKGYTTFSGTATPATNEPLFILLSKN